MKAFTFFMATGLTILLFSKDLIVEGSTCLESCDIGGVFCPSLCSLLKKTSILADALTDLLVQVINLKNASVSIFDFSTRSIGNKI